MRAQEEIRGVIARMRARWWQLRALEALLRAAAAGALVVGAALLAAPFVDSLPGRLAALGLVALGLVIAAAAWAFWPLRRGPSNLRVARFIEERISGLDDGLVTAADMLDGGRPAPALGELMLDDTARRLAEVDLSGVVPGAALRRAAARAAVAVVVLVAFVATGRHRVLQSYDAALLTFFPARVAIEVSPGNARVRAGEPFTIGARIVGSRVPLVPRIELEVGDRTDAAEMIAGEEGFRYSLGRVTASFRYRVTAAGGLDSGPFEVAVVAPPRVAQIDVEYEYPKALGLPPRTETDGGDIYAPEGTNVRVHVHTDRPAETGAMTLVEGGSVRLEPRSPTELVGELTIERNDSYRVALADAGGLSSDGEVEYFIRAIEDRPPEVRVVEPAGDRNVTALEEVEIEAQATDDYGIAQLELVYSVKSGPPRVARIEVPARQTAVSGRQTLYLEDLDVAPGDLVSYYVRARDVARGKRASEARSDIFFLQVRPFEQEFSLAESQAGGGTAGQALGDLVNAQKEVIAATWKLDRRAEAAAGAQSEQDVQAVARAEGALKTRVEQVAAAFGESTMRTPRRRLGPGPQPRVPVQPRPEQEAMTAASEALARAVAELNRLSTSAALPEEMEALNQLLKAMADAREIQVATSAGSGGRANSNYDLSSLFDRELQRSQQTNYETPESSQPETTGPDEAQKLLDAIHALAERQDELVRRQRDLASRTLSEEERRRELEKLTREQSELRRQAEELARQAERGGRRQGDRNGSQDRDQQAQRQGQGQPGQRGQQMRGVSEAMQAAANELRRQDPGAAGADGVRALEQLRDLERQLRAAAPDERRRAMGDAQLEARELAEAERRVAAGLEGLQQERGAGDTGAADERRRLGGDQRRLADRAARLAQRLAEQGAASAGDDEEAERARTAMADAARSLERARLAERMRETADALERREPGAAAADDRQTAQEQRELARALEAAADQLAQAGAPGDEESRRLAGQLAEMRRVRERLDELGRQMARVGAQAGPDAADELSRLRDEYERQLRRAGELVDQAARQDPSLETGGGFTFEGQGMTLSAPGTEAFKQDFSRWEDLRQQAASALARVESSIAGALRSRQQDDRLAAGLDDSAPPAYRSQVDAYFEAIARGR